MEGGEGSGPSPSPRPRAPKSRVQGGSLWGVPAKGEARPGLGSPLRRAQPLPSPDVAHLRPVQQLPAVGSLVPPAHISGVSPQQPDLIGGVASMPQGIAEVLTGA